MRVQTTASLGIVLVPEHGAELSLLLRRADIAMYRAEVDRLGHTTYDGGQDQGGEDRLHRVAELRQAIDDGELVLHYQPKVSVPGAEVVAVEALVRWARPGHGLVLPDDFLPLVEDAGLMPALTIEIVAEGVEHELAAQVLATYGCDTAQGCFWTRPLAPDALRTWMTEHVAARHNL